MGLFGNLFSKKDTAAAQPPVQMPEQKPKAVIKTQRFILDGTQDHMKDIMGIVDKNEDYKLKKKDLIEADRTDENIYEYELHAQATINAVPNEGTEQLQVIVFNTHIGDIKKGGVSKAKKLLKSGNIQHIDAEVSGGNYKRLRYDAEKDMYYYDELEKEFGITIEITYREEITE